MRLDPIQHVTESAHRRFGSGIIHLEQHREQAGALHQRSNGQTVLLPLNEIAFPMPRYQPCIHLRRPVMNADYVQDTVWRQLDLRATDN